MADEPEKQEEPTSEDNHTIEGIEIFAAGTWTDSQGQEREWTESDLDKLLKNFNTDSKTSPLPVKVGHTDDQFNAQVADELGIPATLLTGDEGNGAARLGKISKVRKEGSTLVADFEGVPNVLTGMIQEGFYNAVSVEIDMDAEDDPHLSGIAILGAELPAVGTLAALDTATIFSTSKHPWVTLSFAEGDVQQIDPDELAVEFAEISNKIEELISGKRGARLLRAFWGDVRRRMTDITGKKFTSYYSAAQWSSIIEEERKSSNIKLPIALVAQLSQETAGKMGMAGMDSLKVKNFEIPPELKTSLMSSIGPADESFFDLCMAFDFGIKGMEKLGFCAWLTREYTGKWPNLDNGGSEAPTQPEEPQDMQEVEETNDLNIQEETMGEFVLAPEDLPRLYEALGLTPEATIEDVLAAVMALKGEAPAGEVPVGEEEVAGLPMAEDATPDPRIAVLEQELAGLKGFKEAAEHRELVHTYSQKASKWMAIGGTSEEQGAELAKIHETAGKAAADNLVAHYQKINDAAEEAGVLKAVGAMHKEDDVKPDEFLDMVDEYAKTNNVNKYKALAAMSVAEPIMFAQHNHDVNASMGGK